MKKIYKYILAAALLIALHITASAASMPSSFWSVNAKYEAAVKSENYSDIIKYGNQIINIVSSMHDCTEKRDTIVSRYYAIAQAHASLQDYGSSLDTFNKLYSYAFSYGSTYAEYLRSAHACIEQYTPEVKLYTDGGSSPYYGAKNEKLNGVLFGVCANGGSRKYLDNESMILTYQELGQSLLGYNKSVMDSARKSGCAVEFALNCPNEGNDIRNINRMDSYLKEISDMFRTYQDVPVYLRFAAEFDIWEKHTVDARSYVSAFRHVSDYFRDKNSNVAIVWSPNHVSRWNVDIDEYYPGDRYVDWVGISSYAQKYFMGKKESPIQHEVYFKTGLNSDPVVAVRDIIEKYGDRKPIMLSETVFGGQHR